MKKWGNDIIRTSKNLYDELSTLTGVLSKEKTLRSQESKTLFDSMIHDLDLRKVTERLFNNGHHARAVEEAFKFVNNLVKKRVQLDPSFDGAKLIKHVFSIHNPVLRINSGISQSERDEQLGYMEIISGCITGVRNPRAHEHEWEDTEKHALQLIVLAEHLIDKIKNSIKT